MKPRSRFGMGAMALALGLVAGGAWAVPHGPEGDHHHDSPAVGAALSDGLARLPDGSVNVPKSAQRRMGVRTQVVKLSEQALAVALPARVVSDPNARGAVQSAHGGRLEPGPKGLPLVGQAVRQGELLAWVRYQTDPYTLAQQQSQRAELKAAAELAQQRLSRLESLEGIVPRRDVDAARIEAQSLAQRERSLASSLEVREALRAPITGRVARADLRAGQVVEARQMVMEIVNSERLMIEATTADVALAARIAGAQLQDAQGLSLQFVGPSPALRDGVLPLGFRVRAQPGSTPLAVGQSVTVLARLREARTGVVLPAAAVVRSPSNEPIVWVKSGVQRYAPQPVQVQALDSQSVLVTQGLTPESRVVVQGASLLAQIR